MIERFSNTDIFLWFFFSEAPSTMFKAFAILLTIFPKVFWIKYFKSCCIKFSSYFFKNCLTNVSATRSGNYLRMLSWNVCGIFLLLIWGKSGNSQFILAIPFIIPSTVSLNCFFLIFFLDFLLLVTLEISPSLNSLFIQSNSFEHFLGT